MNAAVPIKTNLNLRLEHELQTAMRRQREARPQFRSIAHGTARHCSSSFAATATRVAREAPAVLVLEGIGVACVVGARAPERFESGVRLAPVIFLGEPIPRTLPDALNATQPEPLTVSMFFIRP
jgi:hypothetical protein